MGVSREARAHRVLVLARDVFPGPGNPTGPPAKMAVSGVFDRATNLVGFTNVELQIIRS